MELFLNILWVLIALAGVITWRTRWTRQARLRPHAAWREWTAFVCSIVLLFFVVSLTDDLHADLVLLEERCNNRRHATCLICPHHSSPPDGGAAHAWAILQASPRARSLAFDSLPLTARENREMLPNVQPEPGRAPPSSVL